MTRELTPLDLRWAVDDDELDFSEAEALAAKNPSGRPGHLGQERALSAMELGLGIRSRGFNIFAVGASGTGRTSTVRETVKARAATDQTPDDCILLYNFEDRDRPWAVRVPPGDGMRVKKIYDELVEKAIHGLEKAFESDSYLALRGEIDNAHNEQMDALLGTTEEEARAAGFILSRTGAALTLSVATDDGAPMGEEEYEALAPEVKEELEGRAEKLQGDLEDALRKVRNLERDTDERLLKLARETADVVVRPLVDDAKQQLDGVERIAEHLDRVNEDILQRLRRLAPDDPGQDDEGGAPPRRSLLEDEDDDSDEHALIRYRVNVLVSHKPDEGAPVVSETHPTASNLLGRIEHRIRGGESQTDFTRIKPGALYRANGGYLLIQAQDLLRDPTAWEGLKRALKNREIELDDPGEPGRMISIASLRPEPVPLEVKVVLIGTPDLYYALSRGDPDFTKLFKVKVDFDVDMTRSKERVDDYLRFLVGLAAEEELVPLAPSGAARVLEHSARISHHRDKLTTRYGWIADLLREASFFAAKSGSPKIERAHVRTALKAREEREGFLETRMREDILERRITVETEGEVVGQTNGLTVLDLGRYSFGMPVRITARVGAGKGDIIDIERETELGGPIHTKGTLILRGLLIDRFGRETPLQMTGTVCMEQSYSDIDGDSASMAEACALLSAIGQIPLRQDTGMTGAIDQRGRVQAVGGVNEKIEGFFRVCRELGERPCRVIIPSANALDLMVDEDVVEATRDGKFTVVAIDRIEEAMQLLTGKDWESEIRPAILEGLHKLGEVQQLTREPARVNARPTQVPARAAKPQNN
jgi:lon-related putative ATP-dependent protease